LAAAKYVLQGTQLLGETELKSTKSKIWAQSFMGRQSPLFMMIRPYLRYLTIRSMIARASIKHR
jgi:hypothetical protein